MGPFFSFFMVFLCSLLSMAFYTLFERKFLGHSQVRKGPNKVGFAGLLQPFSDAMKLFLKQKVSPSGVNGIGYYFAPLSSLFLALCMWVLCPFVYGSYFFVYGGLLFLVISSLSVYCTIMAGWCSNSKYALLGSLRSIAQTISYEISMAIFFFCGILLLSGLSFNSFVMIGKIWLFILSPPLLFVWVGTLLAETNRAPFDFAEGESELVSGFNIEYCSGPFAFIFMAEYTNILVMSALTGALFSSITYFYYLSPIVSSMFLMFIALVVVWARSAFPRMRYDRLMMMTWKSFLPFSIGFLVFVYCVISFVG